MVVAECPKILDVQCIWGGIFVSLEKIFVFKYSQTIFHLVFTLNIYGKSVTRTFLGTFFRHPYSSNGTKIHLDAALNGPSSQYKNKYLFAFIGIKLPEIFPTIRNSWNYSAWSGPFLAIYCMQ